MSKWEEYEVVIDVTSTHLIRVKAQSSRHAKAQAWSVYRGDKPAHLYEVQEDPEPTIRNAYLVKEEG